MIPGKATPGEILRAMRLYQEVTLCQLWPRGVSKNQDDWIDGYLLSVVASREKRKNKPFRSNDVRRRVKIKAIKTANQTVSLGASL